MASHAQDRIDPWGSVCIDDLEKLYTRFGIERITPSIKKEFSGNPFFSRNIVIGHRDLSTLIRAKKRGKPFYCMTGIASSGLFHLGHKVVIDLVLSLKEYGARVFFAVADIDAYVSRPDKKVPSIQKAKEYAIENLAHALALGVDERDVYVQSRMPSRYYEFAFELSKKMTENEYKAIYGHLDPGKMSAVILQIADILHPQLEEFGEPMPGIVPVGPDQDPHIRFSRDIAKRFRNRYGFFAPGGLYLLHMPALRSGDKMSSSKPETAVFLNDTSSEAARKISNAITGGRKTLKEQKEKGGEPDKCRVWALLRYTLESDSQLLEIREKCLSGGIMCGECKRLASERVGAFLDEHHKRLEKTRKKAEKMVLG